MPFPLGCQQPSLSLARCSAERRWKTGFVVSVHVPQMKNKVFGFPTFCRQPAYTMKPLACRCLAKANPNPESQPVISTALLPICKTKQNNAMELSTQNQWLAVRRTKPCPWPGAVCSRDIFYARCQLLPPRVSWRQETGSSTSGKQLWRQRPSKLSLSGISHPSWNLKIYQRVLNKLFFFNSNCSYCSVPCSL